MAAPKEIVDLVEKFERNILEYKNSTYNEEQTRHEFINPFFKALGWDMYNEQGFSEAYKEVLYESSLKVGSTTKAPDYAFKIGERMKFLVEAKKPSVSLKDKADPAHQLRSYAWNAKLPLSILTDFEELAIYDCRYAPKTTDKSDTALIRYLKYTDYIPCWDWISSKFSKIAIQQGYLDKFLRETKDKKGAKEVDAAFLEAISQWREDLARNIAIRNPELSVEELNGSVQSTIDRIIFLRICEDRGIEKYGQIQEIASGENTYAGLCDLFKRADDRYNSGLFHFKKEPDREFPDLLALDLKIDDKVLRDITSSLYPPSPYNFAIISPEILGMVYEQFLGKVIRLTDGHRAKVEEKPEVKKAGGIKYTPTYIVWNLVRKTLGPLINGKTPMEVALIRVLDPACGSGSFLLVAYKYLLDWHLDWYIKNLAPVLDKGYSVTSATVKELLPISTEEPEKENGQKIKVGMKAKRIKAKVDARASAASIPIYKTNDNEWHLTIKERKRILLNNIYGVDIDRQAVEVTKLSLLLKVLEGENQQTVSDLLKYSRERVLPDLDDNIKCGNSLIDSDIMKTDAWSKMLKTEQDRINPFDWDAEFPEIMQAGGFHAIIGNPPYIRIQVMKEWAPVEVEYYKQKYASAIKGNYDIYVVFVEKGLSLLNSDGRLGFILPNKFLNAQYGQPLRQIIVEGKHLSEIVHFGAQQVFSGATTYTCLLFLNKSKSEAFSFAKVDDLVKWQSGGETDQASFAAEDLTEKEWNLAAGTGAKLFKKLNSNFIKLGDFADIFVGLQTSADDVFIMDLIEEFPQNLRLKSESLGTECTLEKELLFPLVSGTDVNRYAPLPSRQYILFPYIVDKSVELIDFSDLSIRYPSIADYLNKNKKRLEERENGRMKGVKWYGYIYLKNMKKQSIKKLCIPRLVDYLYATYDLDGNHFLDNVDVGGVTLKAEYQEHDIVYLLGILNSKLMRWYFPFVSASFRGGWMSANRQFLSQLPIRPINFADPTAKTHYDHILSLVKQMLSLHKQLKEARTPHEQTSLQRQIEATDGRIDALVYELYGLTEEEIKIVEGGLKP